MREPSIRMGAVGLGVVVLAALLACKSRNDDLPPPPPVPVATPVATAVPVPAEPKPELEVEPPKPTPVAAVPGGNCTSAQESTSKPCTCTATGARGTMVCFGRSLTWSACDCGAKSNPTPKPKPAAKAVPTIQPDQKGFCTKDSDCRAPYKCGFQGNCMLL